MNEETKLPSESFGSLHPHDLAWYPLFEHMSKEHGLTLIDDEMNTIASMADESRLKSAGGVIWILVNALRHLTEDELHTLGEAIAKRSGGFYSPNAKSHADGERRGTLGTTVASSTDQGEEEGGAGV